MDNKHVKKTFGGRFIWLIGLVSCLFIALAEAKTSQLDTVRIKNYLQFAEKKKFSESLVALKTLDTLEVVFGNQKTDSLYLDGLRIRTLIYIHNGNYDKAILVNRQIIDIFQEHKLPKNEQLASAFSKMSQVFVFHKDLDLARAYLDSAFSIRSKWQGANKEINEVVYFAGAARIARMGNDTTEALNYYLKAIEAGKKGNNHAQLLLSNVYNDMGYFYAQMYQDYEKADYYFLLALELHRQANGFESIMSNKYPGVVQNKINLKQYQLAIDIGKEFLNKPTSEQNTKETIEVLNFMAVAYKFLGDYKSAFEHIQRHLLLSREMDTRAQRQNISQAHAEYEIKRIEDEKNVEIQANKSRLFKVYFLTALGFVTIISIGTVLFFMFRYKYENKQKEVLQKKNQELTESYAALEQFAYVASHDLKSPARIMSNFSFLLKKRLANSNDEKVDEYLGFITTASKSLYNKLEDLLEFLRVDRETEFDFKWIDSEQLFQQIRFDINPQFPAGSFRIEEPLEAFQILTHENSLYHLLLNLIANGLKFNDSPEPVVSIELTKKQTDYVLSIRDNGIGINPQYLDKIFKIFTRLHTEDKYPGTGVGLAIVQRICEKLHYQLEVRSEEGKGSTFIIRIPVSNIQLKSEFVEGKEVLV